MAADLAIVVKLRDEASKKLKALKGKLGGVAAAAGKVLRAGALVGAAALAGLGLAALKFGNEFKEADNIIRTGTGATGDALLGLKDDFKAALSEIPGDIKAVAKATADWNTLTGQTGPVLQDLVKGSSEAARMLGEELGPLTENAARAFNVFGIAAHEDVAVNLDEIFTASQATGVPMTKLLGLVQTFGPVLKNAGFNFRDTAAFMASVEKAGIDITRIMPGLNNFFRKAAAEGVTDLKGALFDTIEEIKNATTDSEALNIATQKFGAEGAQRMSVAVRNGAIDIEELSAQMGLNHDAIANNAEATATWQDKLKILRNKVLVKLEPLLVKLVDKLAEFADWLGEKLPGAIDEVERFMIRVRPHVERFIQTFKVGLGVVRGALEPLVRFILNNKPALIAAITAIGIAILLAFGPGAVAIAAIVGLIVVLGLLRENWDEIKEAISGVVDDIIAKIEGIPVIGEIFKATVRVITDKVDALLGVIRGLIDFVQELVDFVSAIFRGDWAAAWDSLKRLAKIALNLLLDYLRITFFGTIKSVFASIVPWEWVKGAINTAKNKITGAFRTTKDNVVGAFNTVKTFMKGLNPWNWVKAKVNAVKDNILGAFTAIKRGVLGAIQGIRDGVSPLLGGISNHVKSMVNAVIGFGNRFILGFERIINAVAGGINAIPDISTPFGSIGIPHVPTVSLPRIPHLEHGGAVLKTGVAVVHEGERFSRGGGDVHVHIGRVGVGVTEAELKELARRTQRVFEDSLGA